MGPEVGLKDKEWPGDTADMPCQPLHCSKGPGMCEKTEIPFYHSH